MPEGSADETASGMDASKLKIVLIVAVVLVPAIAIGVFVIGGEGALNTGPSVEAEAGPFISGETGVGGEDQTVVIRHAGGDEIDMTESIIHVSIPNQGREATLVNLPVGDRIDLEANVEGMDMFDRGFGGVGGAVTSTEWSEGEELRFRIKYSAGGARLQPGDGVVVRMEDEESGSTVFETEIEAEP